MIYTVDIIYTVDTFDTSKMEVAPRYKLLTLLTLLTLPSLPTLLTLFSLLAQPILLTLLTGGMYAIAHNRLW